MSSGRKGQCRACGTLSIWCLVVCLCTLGTLVDFSLPARILASARPPPPLSWEGITCTRQGSCPVHSSYSMTLLGDSPHHLNCGWRKCYREVLKGVPRYYQALEHPASLGQHFCKPLHSVSLAPRDVGWTGV